MGWVQPTGLVEWNGMGICLGTSSAADITDNVNIAIQAICGFTSDVA